MVRHAEANEVFTHTSALSHENEPERCTASV
jgi:hypothetical protein